MKKCLAVILLPLVAITLLHNINAKSTSVGCKNGDGKDVDWWIALKAPEGSPYAYIDSDQDPPAWAYNPDLKLADTSGNPLAETVQQIYVDNGAPYIIYNDQPFRFKPKPKVDDDFHAHAKGVIGLGSDQGFWLIHSNPNFPDDPAKSEYTGIYDCDTKTGTHCGPKSGQQRYGQSYLCLTLDADNLEKAGQLLQIAEVVVAGSDLGDAVNHFPELAKIVSGYQEHQTGVVPEKETKSQTLQTLNGEQLLQFAMSPTEKGDDVYLYEELVEPKLKSGLWVETWKEGKDFPSYCPSDPSTLPTGTHFKYETRTINKIKVNDDLEWTNPRSKDSGDHSKWAITHAPGGLDGCGARSDEEVTTSKRRRLESEEGRDCAAGSVKVVCIGDINRAGHQLQRGGGTVCFTKNPALWQQFLDIVAEVGECGQM